MAVGGISEYVSIQLERNQTNSMESIALISQKLVERMNDERREKAVDLSRPDYVRATNERGRLMEYKGKIADELSAMSKAKGAIEWAASKLNTMLAAAQSALGTTDPAVREALATTVDEAISFINNKVDGATQKIGYQKVNLVGDVTAPNFDVDDLYIRTGDKGGRTMVEGAYMGSRHKIVDQDGFAWIYSDKDKAYIQRENTAAGTPTGNTISTDGLTLDSFDHDTGVITFGGSGTLTGTVVRGGLGVLDSELYNNFATDEDIQHAIDDLNAAIGYVSSKGSSIKADATLIQNSSNAIREKISNLNKEIDAITREELDETEAKSKAARLKMALAVNNINLVAQHNTALVQNLLDLTQGFGPAPGVFGSLGY